MGVAPHHVADTPAIVRELARRLREYVRGAAFDVILYGSYARGTPDAESDIDILIRYDGDDADSAVEDAALRIACDLMFRLS
ncbi:nucleotidyltransferase domain-containing protein [Candidatus Binatia bacterium]|nr:nucleotidyltransferase domain-containing protein [Candidatus Binatia bacterium]